MIIRKIFCWALCFTLINSQIAISYAQETKTANEAENKVVETWVSEDTDTESPYVRALTVLAVTWVAMALAVNCGFKAATVPSVASFVLTSGMFLFNEVKLARKLEKYKEYRIDFYQDPENLSTSDMGQIKAVTELLTEYNGFIAKMQQRVDNYQQLYSGILAAALIATTELVAWETAAGSCAVAATAAATAAASNPVTAGLAPGFLLIPPTLMTHQTVQFALGPSGAKQATSSSLNGMMAPASLGTCTVFIWADEFTTLACSPVSIAQLSPQQHIRQDKLYAYLNFIHNLIMSSAAAEENKSSALNTKSFLRSGPKAIFTQLGVGIGLIPFLFAQTRGLGFAVDSMIGKPATRALMFAGIATAIKIATNGMGKNLEVAKRNRDYVQNLLDKMTPLVADTSIADDSDGPSSTEIKNFKTLTPTAYNQISDGEQDTEFGCITPADASGQCPNLELDEEMNQLNNDIIAVDPLAINAADTVSNAAQAAGSGDTAGANLTMSKLTGQSSAIGKKMKQMQKGINNFNKKNKLGRHIDFDRESREAFGKIAGVVKQALMKNGYTTDKLASMGALKDFKLTAAAKKLAKKKKPVIAKSDLKLLPGKNFKMPQFNMFSNKKGKKENATAKQGEGLSAFKTDLHDIAQKPGVSIFKIITYRYRKTAVPILLRKKK